MTEGDRRDDEADLSTLPLRPPEAGGEGGTKLGGFSLRPEILPSEISLRKLSNPSSAGGCSSSSRGAAGGGGGGGTGAGTGPGVSSILALIFFPALSGLALLLLGTVLCGLGLRLAADLTSILCTKFVGDAPTGTPGAAAPSGGIRSPWGCTWSWSSSCTEGKLGDPALVFLLAGWT